VVFSGSSIFHHDITEILLKVALNTIKQRKTKQKKTNKQVYGDITNFLWNNIYFHFQQYFSYIVAVSFIDGGNWRKPPTCRKSLTNFIT
jgi:hypothetical protein